MLKIRSFSICIFLCVLFSTSRIFASDYFSNALRIFNEGRFFEASVEFERAVFFESDNNKVSQYRYYKSCCYKELGDIPHALEELNSINQFNLPDSLFFLIRYERAICNYLINDPNQCLWNIEEIRMRFPDSLQTAGIIPLNILCFNKLGKWNDAFILWNYFLDNSGLQDSVRQSFKIKISSLYDKKSLPRSWSPKIAQNLSRFIPGSGQMYCGAVFEGTFNLLMNASLLGYAAFEFYNKYYLTGYFVGLGLFNKTYTGGMHRAYLLAGEKNLTEINKFNALNSSLLIAVLSAGQAKKPGTAIF
jgi:hypothetical protein